MRIPRLAAAAAMAGTLIAAAGVAAALIVTPKPAEGPDGRLAEAARKAEVRVALPRREATAPLAVLPKPEPAPRPKAVPAVKPAAVPAKTPVAAPPARAPRPAPAARPAPRPLTAADRLAREQRYAQALLAEQIAKYPILKGTTLAYGSTRNGAQAEAFYKSGRIVVNPSHRASIERIVAHEVWHVIDWRLNGRIDWGERIPPAYPRSLR